jgi:hypothetical protein
LKGNRGSSSIVGARLTDTAIDKEHVMATRKPAKSVQPAPKTPAKKSGRKDGAVGVDATGHFQPKRNAKSK